MIFQDPFNSLKPAHEAAEGPYRLGRQRGRPGKSAKRRLFPSALPLRSGAVQPGDTGAGGDCARTFRRLSLRRGVDPNRRYRERGARLMSFHEDTFVQPTAQQWLKYGVYLVSWVAFTALTFYLLTRLGLNLILLIDVLQINRWARSAVYNFSFVILGLIGLSLIIIVEKLSAHGRTAEAPFAAPCHHLWPRTHFARIIVRTSCVSDSSATDVRGRPCDAETNTSANLQRSSRAGGVAPLE